MKIEYLKILEENPNRGDDPLFTNEPISLEEIEELEQLYNNGKPYPKALKELLYLAGNYCHALDYGGGSLSAMNSEKYMRKFVERSRARVNGPTPPRPYHIIEIIDGGSVFLFVYLDEGDNPEVHEGITDYEDENFRSLKRTIPEFIKARIDSFKKWGI